MKKIIIIADSLFSLRTVFPFLRKSGGFSFICCLRRIYEYIYFYRRKQSLAKKKRHKSSSKEKLAATAQKIPSDVLFYSRFFHFVEASRAKNVTYVVRGDFSIRDFECSIIHALKGDWDAVTRPLNHFAYKPMSEAPPMHYRYTLN